MENKIRVILSDFGFVESESGDKIFHIKDGILTVSIFKPNSAGSVNEEIRQTREKLLENLETKILTVCTLDDTGGILMLGKEKVGEINRLDGVMELDLKKLPNNGSN
ncbi:MAG TPA: hypothetical protein VFA52_02225 [Candidatus Paceibacterota bacterium]|nr:hypothetical protein [Candidatus Paceibacterota bacterium]